MPLFNPQNNVVAKDLTLIPLALEIDANTNDLSIESDGVFYSFIAITNTSGGSVNLTGVLQEHDGHFLRLYNSTNSGGNIVLKQNDGASAEGNRFEFQGGADVTLAPGQYQTLTYIENAWR